MYYKPLLLPLLIQVALSFIAMARMYHARIGEMRRKSIDPQTLATRAQGRAVLTESAAAADNFSNLFETPVLFYAGVLLALTLLLQDPVVVAFAWMYVLLRAAHSMVHSTYNNVMHRFYLFIMSSAALLGMWTRLGWYILAS